MIMKNTPHRLWCPLSRGALGLLFVYAGAIKLLDLPRFTRHVGDFGIVFDSLVNLVAITLCVTELTLGVGLLVNVRGALPAIVGLLLFFIGVLVYGIAIGLDIECGCWGTEFGMTLGTQLTTDLGLLGWCSLIHWSCQKCK